MLRPFNFFICIEITLEILRSAIAVCPGIDAVLGLYLWHAWKYYAVAQLIYFVFESSLKC